MNLKNGSLLFGVSHYKKTEKNDLFFSKELVL